jgi:cytochrome d ubiquinol oxidase subunit I
MILTGILAAILYFRKRLFDVKSFQLWCMAMMPSGFIALLAGWFVTEVGRQPFTVYGVVRTAESISPVIAEQLALSLGIFIVVYTLIFGTGSYYILKLIGKGPKQTKSGDGYYEHGQETVAPNLVSKIEKEGKNV